jgi:hypothetical protein
MNVLYNDKTALAPDDPIYLILLHRGWHVIANGYLCQVADIEEGRQVVAKLKAVQQTGATPNDLA